MPLLGWDLMYPLSMTHAFICGHCGERVASNVGLQKQGPPVNSIKDGVLFICPHCKKPTYFEGNQQIPGVSYGADVGNLPESVASLYHEARSCLKVSAFTASVLATRKLLMNVAVSVGAAPGAPFTSYVAHLQNAGYIAPKSVGWADHIRSKGNEATHEIPAIDRKDAEELVNFVEMILKLVYDYPTRGPKP